MTERDRKLSRRDFLKVSASFATAAALSKLAFDLDFPNIKEEESEKGIRIIDNIGIKREGKIVDVIADKDLIHESILKRAKRMVSDDEYPKVEKDVDRLTISFGARTIAQIKEAGIDEDYSSGLENKTSVKGWIRSRMYKILSSEDDPYGCTFVKSKEPVIYMNTGKTPDWFYKSVWDHETAHLIYKADPTKYDNDIVGYLKILGLGTLIDTTVNVGTVLTASNIISHFRNQDTKTFLKDNEEKIGSLIYMGMILGMIPSDVLATDIDYYYFNKFEVNASNAAKKFPTPDSEFNKMIKIVPRI